MKKTLASFLAFFLILSAPAIFAQMPLGVPVAPAVAPTFEKVGIIAAAQGSIELTTPGQVGRIAKSGQPVFMGDEIKTDAKGHLQILFLDQTVFTIGPNSKLVVDEFVYDAKTDNGKIKASITKGVFRYVSGKIAAKNKDSVSVKLPTATIGFRGTIVGGNVGEDGGALAALLGPGANNDAGENFGSFVLQNDSGDQQEVNRAGFGARVGANGQLSGAFQLSQDEINGLTAGLAPSGGQSEGNGEGGSATDQSGETTVLTGENSGAVNSLDSLSSSNDDTSTTAAQDAANENAGVANGPTKMSDLTKIATGIFHYYCTGTYNGTGSMNASIDINFGAKTVGGGNSSVYINDGIAGDTTNSISALPFGNSGPAAFHWGAVSGGNGTFDSIDVTLGNSGGVVANQATVNVAYTPVSTSPVKSTGSAEGPRSDGPTVAP